MNSLVPQIILGLGAVLGTGRHDSEKDSAVNVPLSSMYVLCYSNSGSPSDSWVSPGLSHHHAFMHAFAFHLECSAKPPGCSDPNHKFCFTWLAFIYLSVLNWNATSLAECVFPPQQNCILICMLICLKYVSPQRCQTLKCERCESVLFTNLCPAPVTVPDTVAPMVWFLFLYWLHGEPAPIFLSLQHQPQVDKRRATPS